MQLCCLSPGGFQILKFSGDWSKKEESMIIILSSLITNILKLHLYCRYKDILQGDFFEDYFLLAYKSLSWLHWSREKCSKTPWIVKTDDDMINNIWKIGALVEALKNHRNTITCSTKTEKVIRQKTGTRIDKWVSAVE